MNAARRYCASSARFSSPEVVCARRVRLLLGNHQIAVRQLGYKDFTEKISLEPGQTQTVDVTRVKDPGAHLPAVRFPCALPTTYDPRPATYRLRQNFRCNLISSEYPPTSSRKASTDQWGVTWYWT
jgi:PEGA domain